jgi:hypothetical protein
MVTRSILTGVRGRSPWPVGDDSIARTTSRPPVTLPKTGCLDWPGVNQSRKALCLVLMKNCAPPLSGCPVLAIDSVPTSFEVLNAAGCSSCTLPSGDPPVPQRELLGSLLYSQPNWIMKSLITRWKCRPS